jgi:hypothetical protein
MGCDVGHWTAPPGSRNPFSRAGVEEHHLSRRSCLSIARTTVRNGALPRIAPSRPEEDVSVRSDVGERGREGPGTGVVGDREPRRPFPISSPRATSARRNRWRPPPPRMRRRAGSAGSVLPTIRGWTQAIRASFATSGNPPGTWRGSCAVAEPFSRRARRGHCPSWRTSPRGSQHLPSSSEVAFVHGDYRLGNALFSSPDRLEAVRRLGAESPSKCC